MQKIVELSCKSSAELALDFGRTRFRIGKSPHFGYLDEAACRSRDVMHPILFPCSHCSETITVPPDVQWRALPCPHCKQVTLVPTAVVEQGSPTLALRVPMVRLSGAPSSTIGVPRDQGPDFTETLRKAREATDSIFNDEDEDSDSLFGSQVTPRKLVIPPHAQSLTPPSIPDPSQATLRIPGLPELPPIRLGSPTPTTQTAKPLPVREKYGRRCRQP